MCVTLLCVEIVSHKTGHVGPESANERVCYGKMDGQYVVISFCTELAVQLKNQEVSASLWHSAFNL